MAVGSVGKRKSERKGCSVKAQILVADKDPIDCVVVDFSGTGARAHLSTPLDLPPRFKLFIPSRPETKRVLLRWNRGTEIGLEYSTGVADENSMFELADRVDRLEAAAGTSPDIDRRIAAIEEKFAEVSGAALATALLPADAPPEAGKATFDADALERQIEKVARTAEDQARRIEQSLVSRMDQTEGRLRTAFPPDLAERIARLEVLAESSAVDRQPAFDADALERQIEKVARTAEDQTRRIEQSLVSRMDQTEGRLRATFAPDMPERMARLEAVAERGAFDRQATIDAAALERQIEKVARTAEDQTRRIEQSLDSRMDQTEERLRAAFAPDMADRLARLEALTESRAAELQAGGGKQAAPAGPDPSLVRRMADLEARVMAVRAPAAPAAPDLSDVHERLDMVALQAEEYAARVERFVNARIDDVEARLISSPSPPIGRDSRTAEFELQVRELAARLEQGVAQSSFDRLVERVSDLEMSLMEVRTEQAEPAPSGIGQALLARIAQIEERNGEIIGALRNVLALLSARDDRRAAG